MTTAPPHGHRKAERVPTPERLALPSGVDPGVATAILNISAELNTLRLMVGELRAQVERLSGEAGTSLSHWPEPDARRTIEATVGALLTEVAR